MCATAFIRCTGDTTKTLCAYVCVCVCGWATGSLYYYEYMCVHVCACVCGWATGSQQGIMYCVA